MSIKQELVNQPFWTPVLGWEKKWVSPTPTPLAATLGARPGNTMRPAPNGYKLCKWVVGEQVTLNEIMDQDDGLEILPVKLEIEEEPLIIAGIDVNELKTSTGKQVQEGVEQTTSPTKLPAAPVIPIKTKVATEQQSIPIHTNVSPTKPQTTISPTTTTTTTTNINTTTSNSNTAVIGSPKK